jgi:hypothetical protein
MVIMAPRELAVTLFVKCRSNNAVNPAAIAPEKAKHPPNPNRIHINAFGVRSRKMYTVAIIAGKKGGLPVAGMILCSARSNKST